MKAAFVSSAVVSSLHIAHGQTWIEHDATQCATGHGARNLDPAGRSYKDDISVDACKAACLSTAGCTAVQYLTASGGTSCYRLADLQLSECTKGDPHWTMYSFSAPTWEAHPTYHCWTGHGARDLDSGSSYKDDISLAECEATCATRPECAGVQFLQASGGTSCYHVADVSLKDCEVGEAHWSTFLRPDEAGYVAHVGYNCSQEHGARSLDAGSYGNSSITVEECEAGCSAKDGCAAVRFLRANGGSMCNRLADVDLTKCLVGDAHWTTFMRARPRRSLPVSATWAEHSATNCQVGHGAQALEHYKDDISVTECEAACMAKPECDAIQYLTASGGLSCYALMGLELSACAAGDPHWSVYVRPRSFILV